MGSLKRPQALPITRPMVPSVPLRVGLAGLGFWGMKLARNLAESPATKLVAICDPERARLEAAAERHPGAAAFEQLSSMLETDGLEAVVIATPEALHFVQAKAALDAGKHVLVEKPLTLSVAECASLELHARRRSRTLMVGHTFLYSEPVRLLRELIRDGELGQVLYCYAQRLNLGAIRSDVSAMWDLAPHDISILHYVLDCEPVMVSAQQYSLIGQPVEDIAMVNMVFPGGAVGHIHVSRLDPRKVRQLVVVGELKMAVYDDLDAEMPVRVYDKGVISAERGARALMSDTGFAHHHFELRSGDVVAPKVAGGEPLRAEIDHFAHCARAGEEPLTDAASARAVVAVLEAAELSSGMGGQPTVVYQEPSVAAAA
jgi:predicted dehydrogenase